MEGADVKTLQQNLITLGYDLGAYGADGDFGSATRAAVISFQENNGLDADGIAGAQTLAKIASLLEGESDAPGDAPQPPQPGIPDGQAVQITAGTWNVRTGPGTDYAIAGVVSGGDALRRVEIGDWIPVIYGGELRFISPQATGG